MSAKISPVAGHSPVAPLMEQFVQEKRACGYKYCEGTRHLRLFDAFLCEQGLTECELSRSLTRPFLATRPHETALTQQQRISVIRDFAAYMCRHGYRADVPDGTMGPKCARTFCPHILTHAEVQRLLNAVDQIGPEAQTPHRHLVMPELFRLLYGCGFRVGEVLQLRVADVDLDRGVITVREGKFRKDRLVPPALPLVQRLRKYAAEMGPRPPNAYFFPGARIERIAHDSVYKMFRRLLYCCYISHGGRGKGPRIHDLRHTFAVHRLLQWLREGADLDDQLPVLSIYLGHRSLERTQQYLHLTAEMFPELARRSNDMFGCIIPGGTVS